MSRLPEIEENKLTDEQRHMFDEIMRVRGQVRGPFAIWLNSPPLGELALKTQDWFQKETELPARLVELAILVMARKANAQFAWAIHEKRAVTKGLSKTIVEQVNGRMVPSFESEDERMTYDIACELFETRTLSSSSYERAVSVFGVKGLVELVSLVGFYVMVAMVLNTFDADAPGEKTLLS
jgi:4-carboxymuconolactone decarboxylase